MTTTGTGSFVSADSHIVEPADLFTTRMDKRFRDRAPRVESREDADYYVMEGVGEIATGLGGEGKVADDKADGKPIDISGQRHADTRPGAWDVAARLEDQDLDNIRAEVVYPGLLGLWGYAARDPDYHLECVRVYNDWIVEFCAQSPERLIGVGILPMRGSINRTIKEAQRIAKLGLKSLTMPLEMEGGYANLEDGTRLWSALEEIDLPLAFHVGSSTIKAGPEKYASMGTGVAVIEQKICMTARGMTDIIVSGVPQAHPKLRFVMVEGGIGWISAVMRMNDHWWEDHRHWMEPKLEEPPSAYYLRQFWATFEDDRAGILTRELMNVDHLMWGSDYPHTEGVFPFSREQIAKDFVDVSDEERQKMVGGNAVSLYDMAG